MDGRKTEITGMIGAAFLIEQDIPIRPGHRAVVEIIDHGITIFFAKRPALKTVEVEFFLTAFCKEQVRHRVDMVDQGYIDEQHGAARPGLIPVEADAPYIGG